MLQLYVPQETSKEDGQLFTIAIPSWLHATNAKAQKWESSWQCLQFLREAERERERERGREWMSEWLSVCMNVWERERVRKWGGDGAPLPSLQVVAERTVNRQVISVGVCRLVCDQLRLPYVYLYIMVFANWFVISSVCPVYVVTSWLQVANSLVMDGIKQTSGLRWPDFARIVSGFPIWTPSYLNPFFANRVSGH